MRAFRRRFLRANQLRHDQFSSTNWCGESRPGLHVSTRTELTFGLKQPLFHLDTPAISPHPTILSNNAMTRDRERGLVCGARGRHRSDRSRRADAFGHLRVRPCLTDGNLAQRLPHTELKCGPCDVEWHVERADFATRCLLQCSSHVNEGCIISLNGGARDSSQSPSTRAWSSSPIRIEQTPRKVRAARTQPSGLSIRVKAISSPAPPPGNDRASYRVGARRARRTRVGNRIPRQRPLVRASRPISLERVLPCSLSRSFRPTRQRSRETAARDDVRCSRDPWPWRRSYRPPRALQRPADR